MRAVGVCGALLLFACGGGPIPSGGKCNVSAQCAAGLLCDTTQKPAVCTDKLANPPPDLAGQPMGDMASSDLAVTPSTDMAATQLDMATAVDLATKD